ncbi:MAG: WD40 repeat domain-containing protein [Anaerolineales bacterium]
MRLGKTIWIKISAGILVFGLASCGPQQSPAPTEPSAPIPTTVPEPTPTPEWEPELLFSLEHEDAVESVAFSPDGAMLASGLFLEVHLWDVSDGTPIKMIEHRHSVEDLDISPNGETLGAGQSTYGVQISGLQGSEEPRQLHGGFNSRIAFSPDGSTLATGNREGTVWIWNLESDEPLAEFIAPDAGWITALAYSPDGEILAAGHFDCLVHIWQVSDGQLLHTFERDGYACPSSGLAFSPDGDFLVGAGSQIDSEYGAKVWAVADGSLQEALPSSSETKDVAFSPDGGLLAIGANDALTLWQMPDFSLLYTLDQAFNEDAHDWVTRIDFSPDGTLLAVGRNNGVMEVWKVQP